MFEERKEVAICVQFYWEADLEEHSKAYAGFDDTKNTGEQNKSSFNWARENPG